eukprot:10311501-Karenia_brevis.AAC.1
MAGTSSVEGSATSRVHTEIQDLVAKRVSARTPPSSLGSDEEAFAALLKGKSAYEEPVTNVSTYRRALVALPDDVSSAPYAADLGDDEVRTQLG